VPRGSWLLLLLLLLVLLQLSNAVAGQQRQQLCQQKGRRCQQAPLSKLVHVLRRWLLLL
jgi:hypothetical protein